MARILIVDDSETLRSQLKGDLAKASFEVLEAADGLEGLELLQKQPIVDLIICDVNMPRLDGFAMCEKLRERPELKSIPIFMLTTETLPEMKERGRALQITAWIIKPYDTSKLLGAIGKVLARDKKKAA